MILGIAAASINKLFYKVLSTASNWPRELRREGKMTVDSPGPVTLELAYPRQRILTIPARLNSLPATAAETVWVLAGRDDMKFLQFYLKRALDFSDDGMTWRAAYGPRIRLWPEDRAYAHPKGACLDWRGFYHDQLEAVIQELRVRPESRRAIIGLLNPVKDHENFTAKDFPCTQYLHFIPRGGCLDLDIHIRSNDILWGLTGVNIFEFTVLQELVAHMTGLPLGKYYHIADSLHYYTDYQKRMDNILKSSHFDIYDHADPVPVKELPLNASCACTLDVLDNMLKGFLKVEEQLRNMCEDPTHIDKSYSSLTHEACEIIQWMTQPLPDICRCMLIYLTTKIWDHNRVMSCDIMYTMLRQTKDDAVRVGMIEWLTRQKGIGHSFKVDILKLIPDYIRPHVGSFIKEENI